MLAVTRERERESTSGFQKGVPIGNLTSQIFANVYMNEFDQFVKHTLKVKYYARYTDDFVIVSDNHDYLKQLLIPINLFIREKLKLELHPNKISITKYNRGADFLGYVVFPHYIKLRTKTKRRILKKLKEKVQKHKMGEMSEQTLCASLQSYLGVLSHANAHKLSEEIKNQFWFWINR